jgi:hypothetical protein
MPGLDHPVKQAEALIIIYLGALAVVLVLHHLGVAREPAVATALTAVTATCLVFGVLWFFREIGRVLGIVCFEDGRCVALGDTVLIYARPAGRRGDDATPAGTAKEVARRVVSS